MSSNININVNSNIIITINIIIIILIIYDINSSTSSSTSSTSSSSSVSSSTSSSPLQHRINILLYTDNQQTDVIDNSDFTPWIRRAPWIPPSICIIQTKQVQTTSTRSNVVVEKATSSSSPFASLIQRIRQLEKGEKRHKVRTEVIMFCLCYEHKYLRTMWCDEWCGLLNSCLLIRST